MSVVLFYSPMLHLQRLYNTGRVLYSTLERDTGHVSNLGGTLCCMQIQQLPLKAAA